MDGGGTDHLGLDFDAPRHRPDRIYSSARGGGALTDLLLGLRFRVTACKRNGLKHQLVSKRPAYIAYRPSFVRRKPALPQVTCRFALAQSCAAPHPRLSPSSTHRRKRKNTPRRRASAKVRLRSPASDAAHKPCAADRATLLQKSPEGRDPSPRSNHDNVGIAFRQMKVLSHAGENWDGLIIAALSQKGRSHTFAKASMRLVANDIDDEVDGFGIDPQATCHRIKPRLQFR